MTVTRDDIKRARRAAETTQLQVEAYGGQVEDGRSGDPALATLLAANALCHAIRALELTLEYAAGVSE